MRVLVRVTRERDEARESVSLLRSSSFCLADLPRRRALASVRATLGPAFSTTAEADVAMDVEEEASAGVQGDARAIVQETAKTSVASHCPVVELR